MSKKKIIPLRIGEAILHCKGVVIVKLIPDNVIELADVEEQLQAAITLSENADFVTVLDGGLTMDVTEEAMTFAAKHDNKKWLAFAIIVRSISERLFANYYLRFKKPIRPTKVFTSPKGAEVWLKQYMPIDEPMDYKI